MYKLSYLSSVLAVVCASAALCAGCSTQHKGAADPAAGRQLLGVTRTRILIDNRYDARPDAQVAEFMRPYTHKVDSMMSPVVGQAARYMASYRPESPLSNLLADILVWSAGRFGEQPDFAVYNMGGIRAALAKGDVTVGDVLDVAPFENKICFLTLSGDKVKELFTQMASRYGEAVSHSVRLEIGRDSTLLGATVNGQPIDPARRYRVATLDFLAQGNDQLVAFKAKTQVVQPEGSENNVRELIMDYFRSMAAKGQVVDCDVEGRITVK